MKTSKSNKLRYYYSPELGVMMPVPVIHRLRYWALAVIVLVAVAVAGFIFSSISNTRGLHQEVIEPSQDTIDSSPSKAAESPDASPTT